MHRVSSALNSGNAKYQVPMSLDLVNQWMTDLRAMPYRFSPYWQTPSEVNLMQVADCKGKAVALYAQMRRCGAKNVRVVIGKRHPYDANTHAWLEWETNQGSFTLDPTFNERAVRTGELDPLMYVASYAYDGSRKYRITPSSYFATSSRVASGSPDRLYIPATTTGNYSQPGFTSFGAPQFYPASTPYHASPTQSSTIASHPWSQQPLSPVYPSRPVTPQLTPSNFPLTNVSSSPTTPSPMALSAPVAVAVTQSMVRQRSKVTSIATARHSYTSAIRHHHIRRLAKHHRHSTHSKSLTAQL